MPVKEVIHYHTLMCECLIRLVGMGPGRIWPDNETLSAWCHNLTFSAWCVIGIHHCVRGHRSVGMGPGRIGCHNQTLSAWCVILCQTQRTQFSWNGTRQNWVSQSLSAWCLIGIQHRLYFEDREQQTVNANQIVCPIMMNHFIVTASQNGRLRACNVFGLFYTQYIHILLSISVKSSGKWWCISHPISDVMLPMLHFLHCCVSAILLWRAWQP